MAEALRDLSYTLVDATTNTLLTYSDGSWVQVLIVEGVTRQTSSSMPSMREDGTPFIDHIPTQDELYGLGARAAYAAHWASPDQIPYVIILKQEIDIKEKIDAGGQTYIAKADVQAKQLVQMSAYFKGRYPRDHYRFCMDKDGAIYMVPV